MPDTAEELEAKRPVGRPKTVKYDGRPMEEILQERQDLIDTVKAVQNYYKQLDYLNLTSRKADQKKVVDEAWDKYQRFLSVVRDLL